MQKMYLQYLHCICFLNDHHADYSEMILRNSNTGQDCFYQKSPANVRPTCITTKPNIDCVWHRLSGESFTSPLLWCLYRSVYKSTDTDRQSRETSTPHSWFHKTKNKKHLKLASSDDYSVLQKLCLNFTISFIVQLPSCYT